MHEGLLELLSSRKGHFKLESGHHGELWFELGALFLRPNRLRRFTAELGRRLSRYDLEAVCGVKGSPSWMT